MCGEGCRNAVEKLIGGGDVPPADWAILCGPEGGFSHEELDEFSKLNFITFVSLGPRILRSETAAVSAIACWQSVWGDWQARPPELG